MSHTPISRRSQERTVKPDTLDRRHAAAQKQLEPKAPLNPNQLSKAFQKVIDRNNANAYPRPGSGKRS